MFSVDYQRFISTYNLFTLVFGRIFPKNATNGTLLSHKHHVVPKKLKKMFVLFQEQAAYATKYVEKYYE